MRNAGDIPQANRVTVIYLMLTVCAPACVGVTATSPPRWSIAAVSAVFHVRDSQKF